MEGSKQLLKALEVLFPCLFGKLQTDQLTDQPTQQQTEREREGSCGSYTSNIALSYDLLMCLNETK